MSGFNCMILITDYKLTINAKKVKKKLVTASFSCHCDNMLLVGWLFIKSWSTSGMHYLPLHVFCKVQNGIRNSENLRL